jgi:hypothetical protein
MFDNPYIKRIYAKIEEQLFAEPGDEPDPELSKDSTLPDFSAQDDRIDEFVSRLDQLIGGFEIDEKKAGKRKENASESGEAKKPKVSPEDIDEKLVLEKCQKNDTKSLTIPLLKTYLQLKGVAGVSKMNKGQMVDKICEMAKPFGKK